MLMAIAPQGVDASVREAHFSDRAGTTTEPVDMTELHARYDDTGRLAVVMRFADPLPETVRLRWVAAEWDSDGTCGNSVDVRLWVSGEAAMGWWQPGYLTVVYDIESASVARDRRSVKTVIRYEMKDRDFRCLIASVDGSSERIGPASFDLPLERLSVKRAVWIGSSIGRPGRTVLRVSTADGAKVEIVVRRKGRRAFVRRFTAAGGSPVRQQFKWSCARPGIYRFVVRARDSYGNSLVRRGRWTISPNRCERLLN